MITYDELITALHNYVNAPMSPENKALSIFIVVGGTIFFIWFTVYLRKEYLRRKSATDTFNTDFGKTLKYPGFYPGGVPKDEKEEAKKEDDKDKPDKWGKVNDEY